MEGLEENFFESIGVISLQPLSIGRWEVMSSAMSDMLEKRIPEISLGPRVGNVLHHLHKRSSVA